MTIDPTRHADRFTDAGLTEIYEFPVDDYEYEPSQDYREVTSAIAGANYAWDFAAAGAWAKEVGEEPVRFTIWGSSAADADTKFEEAIGKLRRIGLGKLWTIDAAGARRWAWAKLRSRPSYRVGVDDFWTIQVEAVFARFSDWYNESPITGSQAISSSPTSWPITLPGNARSGYVLFRLRSNSATGFTNPVLTNLTTGQSVSSSRDAASANSELKIDNERMSVEYSNDDGVTYTPDYDLVSLGPTQAVLMELDPGENIMQYSDGGTPNATLEWTIYPAWH